MIPLQPLCSGSVMLEVRVSYGINALNKFVLDGGSRVGWFNEVGVSAGGKEPLNRDGSQMSRAKGLR